MSLKSFTFNPFSTNCYIIESSGEAVIVDPSCHSAEEIEEVVAYVDKSGLVIKHLLLTHAHIDHIFGCNVISETYGLSWKLHRADWPLLDHATTQAQMFQIPIDPPKPAGSDLSEGDTIHFGDEMLSVLHTPGHSPGSVSFVSQSQAFVIAGDVLFRGSIGRTDLWQGSLPTLMSSIFQKLLPLGDQYAVYSGHGPETSVGVERRTNPFLTGEGGFDY